MTYKPPTCDKCSARNPVKHTRVMPRNFHLEVALLCAPCGRKLGYQPVSYDRPYVGLKAQRLL